VPLCVLLAACSVPEEVAVVDLELGACLVPRASDLPGCGDGLRARFEGEVGIPACLAVETSGGSVAALPLHISPDDGRLSGAGGSAPSLPLSGEGDTLRVKLFVLDRVDTSLCEAKTFTPGRACDARLPRCLLATQTVEVEVLVDTTTVISFGGADHECLVECNDPCRPGDPACTSVCARSSNGEIEACDGVDNDCDAEVDEGCDRDEDGFCEGGVPVVGGDGRCPDTPRDCDDDDAARFPGATESCDAIDNDCDGQTDEPQDLAAEAPLCEGIEAKGVCSRSRKRCDAGRWLDCDAGSHGWRYDGPVEERCGDGFNNDCDDQVDIGDDDCLCAADGATRPCGLDIGTCRSGVQRCTDSAGILLWGPCDGVDRAEEECNGLDDDCDGRTDEDLVSRENLCPAAGVCADLPTVCADGAWRCGYPAAWEALELSCDGLDNDCDGETDESLAPAADADVCPVTGVCADAAAHPVCIGGGWRCEYPPTDYEAEESSCDGKDNDCDGEADEGCACTPDAQIACGTDVGICEAGVQRCESGTFGPCRGGVPPEVEVCNGQDDDCDGVTDEGLFPPDDARCKDAGVCAGGPSLCNAGQWVCAAEGLEPAETLCDGEDNDCDGETDETDDLIAPDEPACPASGVCAGGDTVCVEGGWTCAWPKSWEATERSCDGLDNDCDGQVDEGPLDPPDDSPCPAETGVCVAAATECVEGGWACRVPDGWEAAESLCDGLDNDCDGQVDNDPEGGLLSEPCYEGPPETLGIGMCQPGGFLCQEGQYDRDTCVGETRPGEEVCNLLDDDCDGDVDELPSVVCGEGVCANRIPGCTDGLPASCDGQDSPERADSEVCDGFDNDCDGRTDEDEQGDPLGGACYTGEQGTEGVGECRAGRLPCDGGGGDECIDEVLPEPESCDGLDNDCDGMTDLDDAGAPLEVACYTGAANTEDVGPCRGGVWLCAEGELDRSECVGEVVPADETCNGEDDDCDGFADVDPWTGEPLVEVCFDGPPERIGVGPCVAGRSTCNAGVPGACIGQVPPVAEECDAIDNDCDGDTDNGPATAALRTGGGLGSAVLPGGLVLGSGDFTVEAWVRPEGWGQGMFGQVLDQTAPGGLPRISLNVTNDEEGGTATFSILAADGAATMASGATRLTEGWHHLAGVRQGLVIRLYVDGQLDRRETLPAFIDLGTADSTLAIGRRTVGVQGNYSPYAGHIDEVRVSRGARYRGRFVPRERLEADRWTAALWRFDEGAGATAASDPPTGGLLTLEGDAWSDAGLPVRWPVYRDADLDGFGNSAETRPLCQAVEGWSLTPGDCNDNSPDVGLPTDELPDNEVDDDCDGRLDADDGVWAISLDGAAAHLQTDGRNDFLLGGIPFTWEAWLWLARYSGGMSSPIVSTRRPADADAHPGDGYLFGVGGLAAGGEVAGRPLFLLEDGERILDLVGTRTVPTGRWVHLAVTFEPEQHLASLWMDGQQAGTGVLASMPGNGGAIVTVGGDRARPDDHLHGWLDDLQLSRVRRYDGQIEPAVCPLTDGDSLSLWRFENEAAGQTDSEGVFVIATTLVGAERVASACEDREPPLANCRALYPEALSICEDSPPVCRLSAQLSGTNCELWCERTGFACLAAFAVAAPPCEAGEELAEGCLATVEQALCECAR